MGFQEKLIRNLSIIQEKSKEKRESKRGKKKKTRSSNEWKLNGKKKKDFD